MTRLKFKLLAISILCFVSVAALSTGACSRAKNHQRAYVSKIDSGYLIELKGTRYNMAHDPISLLMMKTHEETYEIILPRIDGQIDGNEIPVRQGYYKYVGNVVIHQNKMEVELAYQNTDDKRLDSLSWNGVYELTPKVAPSKMELEPLRTKMSSNDMSQSIAAARELMTLGHEGRKTVYDGLLTVHSLARTLSPWLGSMNIGEPEKVERWKEDIPDFVSLMQSDDSEVMLIGMSLLSCTEEGKTKLREYGINNPNKQGFVDVYLKR